MMDADADANCGGDKWRPKCPVIDSRLSARRRERGACQPISAARGLLEEPVLLLREPEQAVRRSVQFVRWQLRSVLGLLTHEVATDACSRQALGSQFAVCSLQPPPAGRAELSSWTLDAAPIQPSSRVRIRLQQPAASGQRPGANANRNACRTRMWRRRLHVEMPLEASWTRKKHSCRLIMAASHLSVFCPRPRRPDDAICPCPFRSEIGGQIDHSLRKKSPLPMSK